VSTTQIHILVGCSDARDVGQVHLDVVERTRAEYLAKGIRSELFVLRTPGCFVTGDVLTDLGSIVASTQREIDVSSHAGIQYFVHVQVHGELNIAGEEKYNCGLHHVEVEAGSVFNCGMLGATGVAVDLERLIIELAPSVELGDGRVIRVDSEDAVRRLLRGRYGYDGYLAGDWVKSVDDLRTHARVQKAILERAVRTDPELRSLDIRVTAGIQDYRHNAYIRVDGGVPDAKFWDEGQKQINQLLAELPRDSIDRSRQSERQKPLVILFAMGDIRGSRARGLACFAKMTGRPITTYEPNTVFAMSGSALDLPGSPLGPYAIAGLFYAVKGLGLKKILVMGNNQAQADRMVRKITVDPIASLIVKHFDAELMPIVAE
jgi:hypothetical protein